MKSLSVSEEFVSKGEAEGEAECHSSETSEVIGVEVVLSALARVVAEGEGASKFITVNVKKCKTEYDAKKIACD